MIQETLKLLDPKDRKRFGSIVLLTILFSLIEIGGISFIMPFIQMATDFSQIHQHCIYESVYSFLGLESELHFVMLFGIILIIYYLFRTFFSLFYYQRIAKFVRESYYGIATKLFQNYVGLGYREYIERNSAHLIQAIVTEANNVANMLFSLVILFGEVFIVTMIYGVLFYVNWKLTLFITAFLALVVIVMSQTVSKMIKHAGEERNSAYQHFYEILNNTFGNFKMIKLQTDEANMVARFDKSAKHLTDAYIVSESLAHVPRLSLEALGFILVIVIVLYWMLVYGSDVSGMIGILTLFIVALYRLMPSFNRIVTNYHNLLFYKSSLEMVRTDIGMNKESPGEKPLSFEKEIELKNISFSYDKIKPTLKNVNLCIKKGEKVAFIGESGSGKSTLIDIIIGLLKPSDGDILIDGIKLCEKNLGSWRKKIGYIPQDVYLFDATVAENVAFCERDEVDERRVIEVLKQAEIYEFLQNKQEGINTVVGEGGVKLSGGQKQRIAIARALYHAPEILILDEATSALDEDTEREIMKQIYRVGERKTLIIISHRLSTIERCDKVFRVKNGKLKLNKLLE